MGGFERGRDSYVPEVKAKPSPSKGYSSYSTMGGFEKGRDSYVPEVKAKTPTGIMSPSEPDNEEDNNSFVSNVTNTAKAIFSAIRGSAIGPASMLNIAFGLAGGEGQARENVVFTKQPVKSNQFKLGTGDFKYTTSDAGIMRKPYEAQRMLDVNKPKGKGTIADQLNAFRRIEKQNNKSVWGPVHSQYYQQANEYMGTPTQLSSTAKDVYNIGTWGELNTDEPITKLLNFIGTGEGGYNSSNTGTIGGKIIHFNHATVRAGKKLEEMTIAEVRPFQAITDPNNRDRLFTIGKYQLIPKTFEMAVTALGLPDDTVLTPKIQDMLGVYLVSKKPGRKNLSNFLTGKSNVSTERAMLDLALEFASVPSPVNIKKGKYGKYPLRDIVAGESVYVNVNTVVGGNAASHTILQTLKILEAVKGSLPVEVVTPKTPALMQRPIIRPKFDTVAKMLQNWEAETNKKRKTKIAKNIQKRVGVKADGIIGKNTIAAIKKAGVTTENDI